MNRAELLRKNINKQMRGIEIAPFHSPILPKREGWNSVSLDLFTEDELRRIAMEDRHVPNEYIDNIEHVDIVGSATEIESLIPLNKSLGKLDYILSSHNFEHLPNPIKFLQGAAKVLNGNSYLSMAIPDKRGTFDFFRPCSETADLLEAFYEDRKYPSKKQAFSFFSLYSKYGEDYAFGQRVDAAGIRVTGDLFESFQDVFSAGMDPAMLSKVHCHVFTPSSFTLIMEELLQLGLISFQIKELFTGDGIEFIVHMEKVNTALKNTMNINVRRRDLLGKIHHEQCQRNEMAIAMRSDNQLRFGICSLEDPRWACPQIRLLTPLSFLQDVKFSWASFDSRKGFFFSEEEKNGGFDLIIIHRLAATLPGQFLDSVLALPCPKVWETDDNFFQIHDEHPFHADLVHSRANIPRTLDQIDAVVVSTNELASSIAKEAAGKPIHVLPNFLLPALFYAPVNYSGIHKDRIKILLGGTLTHQQDYLVITEVLRNILFESAGRIELVCMGEVPASLADVPSITVIPFISEYQPYASALLSIAADLALVPLQDSPFNTAKSNIKWLEYSVAGIAGIYSDVPAYTTVTDQVTGVKVSNDFQSWYSAIIDLLENPKKRLAIAQAAQSEVLQKYSVEQNARQFELVYKSIAAGANGRDVSSTVKSLGQPYGAIAVNPALAIPNAPWIFEQRVLAFEREWCKEAMEQVNIPSLSYLVLNIPGTDRLAYTRTSLEAQLTSCQYSVLDSPAGQWLEQANSSLIKLSSDWIALIDAGDQLAPDTTFRIQQAILAHPQWQLIYTDEDSLTADGHHVNPHCKPDINIDYLRSLPYVGGLVIIKKELFEQLDGFDPQVDGAEDYDLVLRAWERVGDAGIGHIPEVLYHRLQGGGHCNKSIEEILAVSESVLERHLQRLGIGAEVMPGPFPPATRVRYPLTVTPTISIIIPTRNQLGMLQRCVESIIEKTRYPHYEILIVDNDSDEPEARQYLDLLAAQEDSLGGRLRVLRHPGPFNFAAMNNRAVTEARGEYLLLLNNDTAALHEDWLDEMVSQALRPEVGVVGAKLLFPDGKIQHAGVILGMKGPAEHPFIGQPAEYRGYFGRAMLTQNLSAVTGACLLISKDLYQQVGGLDESTFQVSYNDVDLCLKVRERGRKIVFTPWAMLLHEGSASQRAEVEKKPSPEKQKRFAQEKMAFYQKWLPQLAFDPAYNRHLTLASTDYLLEDQAALTWDPQWRPRPRILVHPADREGCGEYRIISPMRALQRAGRVQGWETMRIFEPAEMERFQPDSIVVQRQMEWPQIEALERHKALSKAFRIFEIDDLITNLPVKSLHKAHIHKDIAKRFRKAAGLCQRLVVATEPLALAYQGFSDEVRVQANCIENAVWGGLRPQRREGVKPRVGWAGGVGHTGDLEMIADVVRDLASEVDWIFFGLCPDGLRPYVKEFHSGVPLAQYPAKLASLDLDLALAPLEDNPFNEAKSHLRLLEYGILGYPVVCSDIYPYQGDFPVWRVANRYRDWIRVIREALSDRQALAQMGDRLREQVRAHWLLENRLDDWLQVWLP